ncbi:hypothetical protein AACH06_13555 [Ideonella sp. DXS29W]|uniref:Sulfotransferase domain-containing protein n=1 Tax=Ideonella lacteola TaxID=2984193 RepID=A0ABU9BQU7_9BURK
MPLILHIGLPKTGTTYLQKTFDGARAPLRESGFVYPDSGYYNHQIAWYEPIGPHLPWSAKPGLPERWQSLQQVLAQEDGLPTLISAEALSALTPAGVSIVKARVAARRVDRIIITSRSLSLSLPSYWQQNLKQGALEDLETFAEDALRTIEEGRAPGAMYSHGRTVQVWRHVFDETPISVLPMGSNFTANLRRFADLCALDQRQVDLLCGHVPSASQQNLSFSVDECSKLLRINERVAAGRFDAAARRRAMRIFFSQRDDGLSYEKPRLSSRLAKHATRLDAWADTIVRQIPGCELVS